MSKRKYSFIFSKLVGENPDNVIGLFAYSVYKTEKINYIERYKKEHNGKEPTDKDLDVFHSQTQTDERIKQYELIAETKMSEMVNEILEGAVERMRQVSEEEHRKALSKLAPSFWKHALSGIVGNFAFILFLAVVFWGVGRIKEDLPGKFLSVILAYLGL